MRNKQIKIIGAGPSGLSAAINLAKAGYQVDIFEKRDDTGKRFHGDLQGLENWSDDKDILRQLHDMNIKVNFDCDPFMKLIITNGEKRRVSHYGTPLCYLVKRGAFPGSLDQGLKAQALEAGVDIHFNSTISEDKADIVATGPISQEIFAVDKGIVFRTNYEDTNVFLVNDEAAYKGYAYLLITKGYGCLCTVLFDKFKEVDTCYEISKRMLTKLIPFDIHDPTEVAGVGCFSTQNVFQRDNTLYVGEAAGVQDLMWGFGIKTAIESGYLAAMCIIHEEDYVAKAERYFQSREKATLTGRFLWEMIRFNNYAFVVNDRLNGNVRKAFDLSYLYRFGSLLKLVYPVALWYMKRRYPKLRL